MSTQMALVSDSRKRTSELCEPGWWKPDLRLVRGDEIYVHERHDPTRTQELASIVAKQGYLAHPVLVMPAPLEGDGPAYIHIDGANRRTVLERLGCATVPVQVVDPTALGLLRIESWAHQTAIRARALDAVAAL